MALKIWLPLNGNIHNQGLINLDSLTPSQNTMTFNNAGKIGKCGTGMLAWHLTEDMLDNTWSVATWLKTSSSFSTYNNIIFCKNNTQSTDCQIYFSIINGTSLNVGVNGPSESLGKSYTFATNTWYHVAATYDGAKVSLYINGIFQTSKNVTTAKPNGRLNIRINGRSTNAENTSATGQLSGYSFNDFRLYDHALSATEVAEIAKGLVLHYKLDQPNPNLIISNTFETAPWKTAIRAQEIYQGKLAYRMANHVLYTNTSRGVDSIFPNIIFKENTQYTLSVDWRDDYRTDGKQSSLYFRFQYSDGSTATQIISPSNTIKQWVHSSMTSVAGKTVSKITTTYGNGGDLYITNLKLEEGSIETSYTNDNNSTIIYDCSGYRNNGTIVGSLSAAAGSPRYQVCTHFNGIDNCIITPYNGIVPDNIFTINLWFCKDALGSKNYETLFGGPSGFEMDTRSGGSSSMALYMASVRGGTVYSGTDFTFNKWIMVTMVRDGTNELYYVNGELKKTIEAKNMPIGIYRIGAWASNDRQNFYGDMSDFRIYTTVLSAEQIKELYTTSLKIVSGNPVARELNEL